jgi:hypothetical protein
MGDDQNGALVKILEERVVTYVTVLSWQFGEIAEYFGQDSQQKCWDSFDTSGIHI